MTNKIQIFNYKGVSFFGEKIKGTINAFDKQQALNQLNKNGVKIISLKPASKLFSSGPATKKLNKTDIIFFCRQLSTLINAGVNISKALEIIQVGNIKVDFQNMVYDLNNSITSGHTLYEGLKKWPKYFDVYFCETVNTAEQTGNLGKMLNRLASTLERTLTLKRKIKKALSYPLAVVFIVLIVVIGMMTFLVPKFAEAYAQYGAELPASTRTLIQISNIVSNYWYIVVGIIVATIIVIRMLYKRNENFHLAIDKLLTKVPLFGMLIRKSIAARVASALATSIGGGLPAADAIYKIAPLANNAFYTKYIYKVGNQVNTGQKIANAFQMTTIFPAMIPNMISIGEESGRLADMLEKAAEYLEEEVELAVSVLQSVIEPFIIVLIGLVVVSIIVPLYLPVFNLGKMI